jgi:tryptophan-rich sensory protein
MAANIAACVYYFHPINKYAAYLMVPYLAWVSYATALTFNIWLRNKRKLD